LSAVFCFVDLSVNLVGQELLILSELLRASPLVTHSLIFCVMFSYLFFFLSFLLWPLYCLFNISLPHPGFQPHRWRNG